jgi:hypothetical protein
MAAVVKPENGAANASVKPSHQFRMRGESTANLDAYADKQSLCVENLLASSSYRKEVSPGYRAV